MYTGSALDVSTFDRVLNKSKRKMLLVVRNGPRIMLRIKIIGLGIGLHCETALVKSRITRLLLHFDKILDMSEMS